MRSASKSFNSMNIDIESCVDDEYDWSLEEKYTKKVPGLIVAVKMDMLCFGM